MNHNFKRKEEKFILNSYTSQYIKDIAKKSLDYSDFNSEGIFTDIRTTYLESHDHFIYHLKKAKKKKRFKIRFREYGTNGNFESYVWVELKEKIKGQGYKNRFLLSKDHAKLFLEGKDVFFNVARLNKNIDIKYLSVLYKTIQKLIKKHNLEPALVVQYRRLAFQNGLKGGIRLTFDHYLTSSKTDINNLFSEPVDPTPYNDDMVIAELKTNTEYPEIVKQVKKDFNLKKQSFSKFMFGMQSQDFLVQDAPFSIEKQYTPIKDVVNQELEYCV